MVCKDGANYLDDSRLVHLLFVASQENVSVLAGIIVSIRKMKDVISKTLIISLSSFIIN